MSSPMLSPHTPSSLRPYTGSQPPRRDSQISRRDSNASLTRQGSTLTRRGSAGSLASALGKTAGSAAVGVTVVEVSNISSRKDIYVSLNVNGSKKTKWKTSVATVKNAVAGHVWNESHVFHELGYFETSFIGVTLKAGPPGGPYDVVGQCRVPLRSLLHVEEDSEEIDRWYTLDSRNMEQAGEPPEVIRPSSAVQVHLTMRLVEQKDGEGDGSENMMVDNGLCNIVTEGLVNAWREGWSDKSFKVKTSSTGKPGIGTPIAKNNRTSFLMDQDFGISPGVAYRTEETGLGRSKMDVVLQVEDWKPSHILMLKDEEIDELRRQKDHLSRFKEKALIMLQQRANEADLRSQQLVTYLDERARVDTEMQHKTEDVQAARAYKFDEMKSQCAAQIKALQDNLEVAQIVAENKFLAYEMVRLELETFKEKENQDLDALQNVRDRFNELDQEVSELRHENNRIADEIASTEGEVSRAKTHLAELEDRKANLRLLENELSQQRVVNSMLKKRLEMSVEFEKFTKELDFNRERRTQALDSI